MLLKSVHEKSDLLSMYVPLNFEATFSAIVIKISGTNGATKTELADVGRITYEKNGVTIVDAGFDMLHALNHVLGGNPKDTTSNSGALNFYASIPRGFNDRNIEHVTPNDNAMLRCQFNSNMATRIASGGVVEVYLQLENGTQSYELKINQFQEDIGGASVQPVSYESNKNILLVGCSAIVSDVLTLTGSNLDRIGYEIGGNSGNPTIGAITDNTNYEFDLEDDYNNICIPYVALGDPTSRLHDNINFNFDTSGASSVQTVIMSASFDVDRFNKSVRRQTGILQAQIASKSDVRSQFDAVKMARASRLSPR